MASRSPSRSPRRRRRSSGSEGDASPNADNDLDYGSVPPEEEGGGEEADGATREEASGATREEASGWGAAAATEELVEADDDVGIDSIELSSGDIAFVLGKGGSTKKKLERISHARLDIEAKNGQAGILEIIGKPHERSAAIDFVTWVTDQRNGEKSGDVAIDFEKHAGRCSLLEVPKSCVGFIMGKRGFSLREVEAEFSTLMFFASDSRGGDADDDDRAGTKTLAIFGEIRGRFGTELKIMSSIEHKEKGTFIDHEMQRPVGPFERPAKVGGSAWGVDYRPLAPKEYSYALGGRGKTKRKISEASGCLMEYIGMVAYLVGSAEERERCNTYLGWLLGQRGDSKETAKAVDITGRSDVDLVACPQSYIGYIRGAKGVSLREIEETTGTFCFSDTTKEGDTRILIFGWDANNRTRANELVTNRIADKKLADERKSDPSLRRPPPQRDMIQSRGMSHGYGGGYRDYRRDERPREFVEPRRRDDYDQDRGSKRSGDWEDRGGKRLHVEDNRAPRFDDRDGGRDRDWRQAPPPPPDRREDRYDREPPRREEREPRRDEREPRRDERQPRAYEPEPPRRDEREPPRRDEREPPRREEREPLRRDDREPRREEPDYDRGGRDRHHDERSAGYDRERSWGSERERPRGGREVARR